MGRRKTTAGTAATRVSRAFACAVLASCLAVPASAPAALADEGGRNTWHYVPRDECAAVVGSDADAAEKKEGDQTQPTGGGGDFFDQNTEAGKVAKQMYEALTKDFGFSGPSACGILGSISCEARFVPDLAEGGARFGMDSSDPPAGMAGGGGGLFQFTPYTNYTNSEWWRKDGKQGWDATNQVGFVLTADGYGLGHRVNFEPYVSSTSGSYGAAMYGVPAYYNTVEDYVQATSTRESAIGWTVGYERCSVSAYYGSIDSRVENGLRFEELFDAKNVKADMTKVYKWLDAGAGTPGISPAGGGDDDEEEGSLCAPVKQGEIDTGQYLQVALKFCKDKTIGYSQSARQHNPDMDCSSFVYYCLTTCGVEALDETHLGGYPFTTTSAGGILKGAGFTEHKFTGYDGLQAGDILINSGHMEILYEYKDGRWWTAGAHGDYKHPEGGDQAQVGDSPYDGEVGIVSWDQTFEYWYRPDKVPGLNGEDYGLGQEYADAKDWQKRIVQACFSVGSTEGGMCEAWAEQVYRAAGYFVEYYTCAADAYDACCSSNKRSELRVGMIVAVPSNYSADGGKYGHVGIYIGDGQVMDSIGYVRTISLDDWITENGKTEPRWGFYPGVGE